MPKCYIVTFQVASQEAREKLRARLKAYGRFCPIDKNAWAILSDKSAVDIRDDLARDLDSGDRLFVVRSGTEAAWRNPYGPKNSEWLKKNL